MLVVCAFLSLSGRLSAIHQKNQFIHSGSMSNHDQVLLKSEFVSEA